MVEISERIHHQNPEPLNDWRRYFSFCIDHKVIGIQYLVTTFFFYLLGGALAMMIRAELLTPDSDVLDRQFYNSTFTIHASIMIFLWVIPALVGFGNYLVPLMIGARDMAFPRLNALSFWMIPPAGIALISSFFIRGGAASSGWTSYPPLSVQQVQVGDITVPHVGQLIWCIGVIILGTSSILAAINFIVTIVAMRAPGMILFRMPLFIWATLAASCIAMMGTPVLAGALILLSLDLTQGTVFFNPTGGGDPVVYQHMFWFYSHPAVYIMILPAMGIISEVLPVFARKPIFGYKAIAISSMGIAVLGFMVWAHHMFTSGTPDWMRMFFMVASFLIAVPTGIKVFSWLGTIWGGKLELNSAMLFAMGFVSMFVIGGLSGIILASVPVDIHVHDTYFVVAHLHYVLFGGSVFAIYAGLYFWFPKMTGRMLNETWGKIHFALTFIGFNLCFLPMHQLGLQGMPRRVAQYAPQFQELNVVVSIGGFLLGISTLPFLFNAIYSWIWGTRAGANPWRALGLEWTVPSPPPVENFEEIPVVTAGSYEYGLVEPPSADSPRAALPTKS
ncbi:cytochrome c oxidase subunit I [Gloeobacter kilaueensis]|uniref:Cytochrome c oxidase subunit 1 n=1 Tax=Gloeobacter kilaueensis (strain ATCC BAA-2537 / CCAP 1431/1 / ULC 316 / JS1) TaxID=1183438 RepID=U5QMK4_GLOK1|nr:cytochrome c oxidase subunit I [Gloeobacter kilaueensis]AGY60133.1 cytochrome c oxidase subunit I [Gloeobacter kilaueensis JS1]